MKQQVRVVCVLLLLVNLLAKISAYGNYGLEWGVQVGDRFSYMLEGHLAGESFSEPVYVEVNGLPDLNEPFSPYIVFPVAITSFHWANGSSLGMVDYASSFLIVPIGNWTYLTNEMTPQLTNYVSGQILDALTMWGLEISTYILNMLWLIRLEISKSDGVPNLLHIQIYDGNLVYGDIELVREGAHAFFLIGVGIALVGVSSAAILLRRHWLPSRGKDAH